MALWDSSDNYDGPIRSTDGGKRKHHKDKGPGIKGAGDNKGDDTPKHTWHTGDDPKPDSTPPDDTSSEDAGAKAMITAFFNELNLGALADWAWQKKLEGYDENAILAMMRTDPYAKPFYDAIYPAMDQLSQDGHAMTEGLYLQYENTVKGYLVDFGIPPGIYDTKEALGRMMIGRLELPQIHERLAQAAFAVTNAPPEAKQMFGQFYGANTNGALIAFYMDPDHSQPKLEAQWATANAAGAAKANSLNGMTQSFFEALSKRIGLEDVWQAAGHVGAQRELYTSLIGEKDTPTTATALEAEAGDGAAQRAVARQKQARTAAFAGTGGYAEENTGVSGLSPTSR